MGRLLARHSACTQAYELLIQPALLVQEVLISLTTSWLKALEGLPKLGALPQVAQVSVMAGLQCSCRVAASECSFAVYIQTLLATCLASHLRKGGRQYQKAAMP